MNMNNKVIVEVRDSETNEMRLAICSGINFPETIRNEDGSVKEGIPAVFENRDDARKYFDHLVDVHSFFNPEWTPGVGTGNLGDEPMTIQMIGIGSTGDRWILKSA